MSNTTNTKRAAMQAALRNIRQKRALTQERTQQAKQAAITSVLNSIRNKDTVYQTSQAMTPQMTTRSYLGRIGEMADRNPEYAGEMYGRLSALRGDPTSKMFDPYQQANHSSIKYLKQRGYDVDNLSEKWFENNAWYKDYLELNDYTNSVKKPGKRASQEQKDAYEIYQLRKGFDNTQKAKKESADLQKYLTEMATAEGRTLRDDEIIAGINWNKYPTLKKMKEYALNGAPMALTEGVRGADNDWAYGVLWAALNNGGTGNSDDDIANSYMQRGNTFSKNQYKKYISEKRTKEARETLDEINRQGIPWIGNQNAIIGGKLPSRRGTGNGSGAQETADEAALAQNRGTLDEINRQGVPGIGNQNAIIGGQLPAYSGLSREYIRNNPATPDDIARMQQEMSAGRAMDLRVAEAARQYASMTGDASKLRYGKIGEGWTQDVINEMNIENARKRVNEQDKWIAAGNGKDSGDYSKWNAADLAAEKQRLQGEKEANGKELDSIRTQQGAEENWAPDHTGFGAVLNFVADWDENNERAIIGNDLNTPGARQYAQDTLARLQAEREDNFNAGMERAEGYATAKGGNVAYRDTPEAKAARRQEAFNEIMGNPDAYDEYAAKLRPEELSKLDSLIDQALGGVDKPEPTRQWDKEINDREMQDRYFQGKIDEIEAQQRINEDYDVLMWKAGWEGDTEFHPENEVVSEDPIHDALQEGKADMDRYDMLYNLSNPTADTVYSFINEGAAYQDWLKVSGNVPDGLKNVALMNDREIAAFNKYYNAGQKEEAMAFVDGLQTALSQRYEYYEDIQYQSLAHTAPISSSAVTIAGTLLQPIEMLAMIGGKIFGDEQANNPRSGFFAETRFKNKIRQYVGDQMDDTGKLFYNAGMSAGDSFMNVMTGNAMGLSGKALEVGTLALFGTEAFQTSMEQNLRETGGDWKNAFIESTIDALIETATEIYSVENLLSDPSNFLKYILKTSFSEGSEEFVGSAFGPVVKEMLGRKNEWRERADQILGDGGYYGKDGKWVSVDSGEEATRIAMREWNHDIFTSTLSGALSTGGGIFVGGAQNLQNKVFGQYKEAGRTIRKAETAGNTRGENVLVEAALGLDEGTKSNRQARRIKEKLDAGKKVTDFELGRLAQNIYTETNKSAAKAAQTVVEDKAYEKLADSGLEGGPRREMAQIMAEAVAKGGVDNISKENKQKLLRNTKAFNVYKDFMFESNTSRETVGAIMDAQEKDRNTQRSVSELLNSDLRRQTEDAGDVGEQLATEEEISGATGTRTAGARGVIVNGQHARLGNLIAVREGDGAKTSLKWEVTIDGKTERVDASRIKATDFGTAAIVRQAAVNPGMFDRGFTNQILQMNEDGKIRNVGRFMMDAQNIRLAAYTGMQMPSNTLGAAAQEIYNYSKTEHQENRKKDLAGRNAAGQGNGGAVYQGAEYGTDAWDDMLKRTVKSQAQQDQMNAIAGIAKRAGVRVTFRTADETAKDLKISESDKNEYYGWENGGGIGINVEGLDFVRGEDGGKVASGSHHMVVTFGHEMTHWLQRNSAGGYNRLESFVMGEMRRSGVNVNRRIMEVMENQGLSIEDAISEIVADSCDRILANESVQKHIAEKDQGLFKEIKGFVRDLVDRIKKAVSGMDASSSRDARAMLHSANELAKVWLGAYDEALSGEEALGNEKTDDSVGTESTRTRYAIRQTQHDKATIEKNREIVANMEPVTILKGDEFKLDSKHKKAVMDWFSSLKGVKSNELGYVNLTRTSVNDSYAHGISDLKALLFAAVPETLRNGRIIEYTSNWKNRGYDSTILAAKVKVEEGELAGEYYIGVIANLYDDGHNRYYSHDGIAAIMDEKGDVVLSTGPKGSDRSNASLVTNILKKLYKYNVKSGKTQFSLAQLGGTKDNQGRTLSAGQQKYFANTKAVDKNGNLLRMYHGTKSGGFNSFIVNALHGIYFTDSIEIAGSYSGSKTEYAPIKIESWDDFKKQAEMAGYDVLEEDGFYFLCEGGTENVIFQADENNLKFAKQALESEIKLAAGKRTNYASYINMTNPKIIDAGGGYWTSVVDHTNADLKTWEELTEKQKQTIADKMSISIEELERYGHSKEYAVSMPFYDVRNSEVRTPMITNEWVEQAIKEGYDGVIFKNINDQGNEAGRTGSGNVYVVFNANQIKSINNLNPTGNNDIRYSVRQKTAGNAQKNIEGVSDGSTVDDIDNVERVSGTPSTRIIIGDERDTVNKDKEYKEAVERGDLETATRLLMEKMRRTEGIVPFNSPHGYAGQHKDIARMIKEGTPEVVARAAADMAQYVPENAVLIPIPPHEGMVTDETDTMILARAIGQLTGRPVVNALGSNERESRYQAKAENRKGVTAEEMGFRQIAEIPEGSMPIFVDNVVGSGETAKAARNALGGGITLSYAKSTRSRGIEGLKRATVTFDKKGKLIPLSQRFDVSRRDVRYSRGDLDAEYNQAIKDGDVWRQQELVDMAARQAMPDTQARYDDGELVLVSHGTKAEFNVFDTSISGGVNGTNEGYGIYLTDRTEISDKYGSRQIKGYLNAKRLAGDQKVTIKRQELAKVIKATCEQQAKEIMEDDPEYTKEDALRDSWISNYVYTPEYRTIQDAYNAVADLFIKQQGSDKAIIQEVMGGMGIRNYGEAMDFYHKILTPITGFDGFWSRWYNPDGELIANILLAFDSSQIKSADPITYDDNGNVIPLSERFNPENMDIRYSRRENQEADNGVTAGKITGENGEEHPDQTRFSRATSESMDVGAWMAGQTPGSLQTEDERQLLQAYKDLRIRISLSIRRQLDYKNEISRLEKQEAELTPQEKEDLENLRKKLEIQQERKAALEDELYRITSSEGYAGMMYRNNIVLKDFILGKTQDEVRRTVDEMVKEAQKAKEQIAKQAEELKKLAESQAVRTMKSYLGKTSLKFAATSLKKTLNSGMSGKEIENRLAEMALKRASGESIMEDARALAIDMTNKLRGYQVDTMERLRGLTITIGPDQQREMKGNGMTLASVREQLKGTGVKVKYGDYSSLDTDFEELKSTLPELPDEIGENSADALFRFISWAQSTLNAELEARQSMVDIEDTAITVMALASTVTTEMTNDPAAKKQIDKLMAQVRDLTGKTDEIAGNMESVMKQLDTLEFSGTKAVGMASVLQRDVHDAIEYYNKIAKMAAQEEKQQVRKNLIEQLKSENTAKLIKQQRKYEEMMRQDRKARELHEDNMQIRNSITTVASRVRKRLMEETDRKNIQEEAKPLARQMLKMLVQHDFVGYRHVLYANKNIREATMRALDSWEKRDGPFKVEDLNWLIVGSGENEDTEIRDKVIDDLMDIEQGLLEYRTAEGQGNITLMDRKNALKKIQEAVHEIWRVIEAREIANLNGRNMLVNELALQARDDMQGSRFKGEWTGRIGRGIGAARNGIVYGNMTPEYFFKNLRNKTISQLYDEYHRAENRNGLEVQKAKAALAEIAERHGYKDWDPEKRVTFKLAKGGEVSLTLGEMMSLYATWQREAANQAEVNGPEKSFHLSVGGFYTAQEEKHKVLGRELFAQKAHRLTENDMAAIMAAMTNEQLGYVQDVVQYMTKDIGALGNEASMRMYGIKKYNEKWYFPFEVWSGVKSKKSDAGAAGNDENRAAHFSGSKRRVNNASNALVIRDFTETAVKHIGQMINYNTFAPAIEFMNRVMNAQLKEEGEGENSDTKRNVRTLFGEVYGRDALQYLENFNRDVNGGVKQEDRTFYDRLLSTFKKSAVAGSMSVAAQQPLSYIRAAMMISPKYLATNIRLGPQLRKTAEEMRRYSGVAVIKSMGKFDMNLGQSAREYMKPEGKVSRGRAAYDKASDIATALPELMDTWTWCNLWEAVKAEQADQNPGVDTKSKEFLEQVAERFNEVMRKTQVYDSVLVKSKNMRSQNAFMKSMTSFMAEPTLTANVLADAVLNAKEPGGKTILAKAATTFIMSAVLQAIVKGLISAGRSPQDKKTWDENVAYRAGANLISELNPMNLLPGYNDLMVLFKKGELSDDALSVVGKIIEAGNTGIKMLKGEGTDTWRDLEDSIGVVSQLFTNIPAKNISRDVRAILNYFRRPWADRPTSPSVLYYQLMDQIHTADNMTGVLNSWLENGGWETGNAAYYKRIYAASSQGKQERVRNLMDYLTLARGAKQKTINDEVRKLVKADGKLTPAQKLEKQKEFGLESGTSFITNEYTEGRLSRAEAEALYRRENPKATDKDVMERFDGIDYRKSGKLDEGESYSNYTPLKDAIDANDAAGIRKTIRNMTKNGYKEKDIKTWLSTRYKQEYIAADAKGRRKLQDRLVKAYREIGVSDTDALAIMQKWVLDSKKKAGN